VIDRSIKVVGLGQSHGTSQKCPFAERSSQSVPHASFRLFLRSTGYLESSSKLKPTLVDKDCWMLEGNRTVQAELPCKPNERQQAKRSLWTRGLWGEDTIRG